VIRRSFRIGLRVGLLAGVVFAIVKIMQSRRPDDPVVSTASVKPWPPVPAPTPAPTSVAAPVPAPVVAEAPAKPAAPVKKAQPVKKAAKKATKTVKKATKKAPATKGWVTPQGQVCPLSHPIKAKLASKIYHLPGMFNYTRTRPDRCYASEAAARRDGLTPAKR
jgi:type IV secretory pathway VirB10-like protein